MIPQVASRIEFAVQIKGPECVEEVKNQLNTIGIKSDDVEAVVDSKNKECRLVISSVKPWIELQETIEKTEKRAVLVGFSDESAVCSLENKENSQIKGVIRFCSITANNPGLVIDGVVDGLKPKENHFLSICEFGDVSNGFENFGEIYKNSNYEIFSDTTGRATIRSIDNNLKVSELIGRSMKISSVTEPIGYGIISRAAGIFQNWKRICLCDGVTIWDERDRPLAGAGRRVL